MNNAMSLVPFLHLGAADVPYAALCVTPSAYQGGFAFDLLRFDAEKRIRGAGGESALKGFYLWDTSSTYEDAKTGALKTYAVKESYPVSFE